MAKSKKIISIDVDVWKRVKVKSIKQEVSLSKAIETLLDFFDKNATNEVINELECKDSSKKDTIERVQRIETERKCQNK